MLKPIISRSRSDIQLLYHSRFLTRKSGVLLNSLPKSGTHFFKAIMQGMGYKFFGQFGSRSLFPVHLNQGERGFYTAHTRKLVSGEGVKLLSVRDPAAVALSLVHYANSRKDHYRNSNYKDQTLEDAMIEVFKGNKKINPLVQRYESLLLWAMQNDALILDFEDVRSNPEIMAQVLKEVFFDHSSVASELNKWNPTKRDSDKLAEKTLLSEFTQEHATLVRSCYEVYEKMKSSRTYDL